MTWTEASVHHVEKHASCNCQRHGRTCMAGNVSRAVKTSALNRFRKGRQAVGGGTGGRSYMSMACFSNVVWGLSSRLTCEIPAHRLIQSLEMRSKI